jgi:hypothetical protein
MTSGWAFLVARGRRQGFRARLVPAVLAERGLAGLVEENRSADGVTLVSRQHRIRGEDVDTAGVLDEHGRPLDIRYGFACVDGTIGAVDEADLAAALTQALATYRRFLADESGFAMELSAPFPLRSSTAPPPRASARPLWLAGLTLRARAAVGLGAASLLAVVVVAVVALLLRAGGPSPDDVTPTATSGSPHSATAGP